ncbi:MAG: hypothetical protein F6J95_023650 [Leptolyngbya sp. SIO1E4]|nr:hypothetical protein [Leptolyngbya sp. SIO1E4]
MQELSIALPKGVPTPKYQLFQRVRYTYAQQSPREGTVTGFEYISAAAALAEGFGSYGWQYSIRPEAGVNKPLEALVGARFESVIVEEPNIEGVANDA